VHGFLPGRSIVSNARLHSGQDVVINLDIKDFFPTINYQRVKGLFRSLGYAEQIAIILGLLCTEAATDEVELDGSTFFVARGQRHLPQGAPTSPMLANLLCRRLDARLTGAAVQLGFRYSRYADDMSFSGSGPATPATQKLLWRIKQIVSAEGFVLHPDKLRFMRSNRRQEVSGLTVNQQPAIERKTLRRFRAVLQQIEKHGPEHKFWGTSDDVLAAVHGFAQYVRMVDRAKGDVLLARVKNLHKRFNYQLPHRHCGPLSRAAFRRHAAAGNAPRTDWWQPRITELPAPAIPAPTVSIAPLPPPPLTSAKRRFSWWRLLLKIIIIMVLGQLLLRILGRLL
jgi:hypothetical protein